jgi:glycosyltransferase involved in cell wall biosynthesis
VRRRRYAFICGVPPGVGGLGVQSGNALRALALTGAEVHAIGPAPAADWTRPPNVVWHVCPASWTPYFRWTPLRRRAGLVQYISDLRIARFAARCLDRVRPDLCYGFTQVSLEMLRWAQTHGVPTILESPNGHIRSFRQIYVDEARRWCGQSYTGHPTRALVRRVETEYRLASRVRVSSEWARSSLAMGGVAESKISVLQQPVDVNRFTPGAAAPVSNGGDLRVCYVGSLDLRKGFVYLLRGVRELAGDISVELVGGTGDRCSRLLLERERAGLNVMVAPGDPRPALTRADVFVLPTLEDGSPFAVAEAMACGVPVVTTTATGAAEWIRPGQSGWVTEPRSATALASTLAAVREARLSLRAMGLEGRADTERRVAGCDQAVSRWVEEQ